MRGRDLPGPPRSTATESRLRRLIRARVVPPLLLFVLVAQPAAAQLKNVLVLQTGAAGRPFALELTGALSQTLSAMSGPPVVAYFEWLDLDHFRSPGHLDAVRRFLAEKYREHQPDLVIVTGDPAIRFALDSRAELWPDRPLVFMATSREMAEAARLAPATAGVLVQIDVLGTLQAALELLPDTATVALVSGGDPYLRAIEGELAAMKDRFRVIRLVNLSVEETKHRLATLPERTVVLYSQITLEPDGRGRIGRQVLTELAPVSAAPLFSYAETYMGYGILGGSYWDVQASARDLTGVATKVLAGTTPAAIPIVIAGPQVHVDARELRRFGVDESRVPPGSEVHFRERNLLQEYRGTLTAIAAVVTVQAVTILALLAEVRRRRAAQAQQRRLSARVLSAQDEERRRIAQDLHDGASQQLALIAIELDQLEQTGPSAVLVRTPAASARTVAERARRLSSELHGLAYQLHPAILDQLGLVPAVQQFTDQFAARHGIRVEVSQEDWPAELPRPIVLSLYRVAQEALQNVAKHSGAAKAVVSFRGAQHDLRLSISDDGRGFGTVLPPGATLGVAGMTERIAHIGGLLTLDSSPGRGTRVTATVSQATVSLLLADESLARRES